MVLYGVIAGESVSKLFMGGFIPGTLMGLALILIAVRMAYKKNYPRGAKVSVGKVGKLFIRALWGLIAPLIVLGGIFSGVFTPSEAAVIAVDYAVFVAFFVYKKLDFKKFYNLVVTAGVTSSLVMFVIATAKVFGWGLAFYPDKSARIFKEPIIATESLLSDFIKKYHEIKSRIIIGHVRLTSVGTVCYENTHPFSRELNGREFVFAHNGTIFNWNRLELGRFKPIGETDSEHIFCYLLSKIEEKKIKEWNRENFEWLNKMLLEINSYGSFNCIFSEGKFLFCYHDLNGFKELKFVKRESPYPTIKLYDEDYEINLAENKSIGQYGYIIASKNLTNEIWIDFKPGELIIFKNGQIVYSNQHDISKFQKSSLTDLKKEILEFIRKSQHKVKLKILIENLGWQEEEIKFSINYLICNNYICQDSRDNVKWYHEDATFYTNPEKRPEIDELINNEN